MAEELLMLVIHSEEHLTRMLQRRLKTTTKKKWEAWNVFVPAVMCYTAAPVAALAVAVAALVVALVAVGSGWMVNY